MAMPRWPCLQSLSYSVGRKGQRRLCYGDGGENRKRQRLTSNRRGEHDAAVPSAAASYRDDDPGVLGSCLTSPVPVQHIGYLGKNLSSVGTLILLYFTLSMSRPDSSGSGGGGGGASDAR